MGSTMQTVSSGAMTASDYIQHLGLEKHPEGGYYREVYRHSALSSFEGFDGPRNLSTSIYFLMTHEASSAMHRIKSDEIWYYHDGDPLEIIIQNEEGVEYIVRLGKSLDTGCVMQYVVPAGCWFGARVADGGAFTLVGCQVTPGFDFRDFELMHPSDV
jgi:predicted cupin superfamily sugar epimerase